MIKNLFLKIFRSKKVEVEKEETLISSLAPKVLTKKEDIEKIQPYLDKLNETIDTKGINNIALTGGYGSGKSTILKTFQYWNQNNYNFLNISLAAFNQNKLKEDLNKIYDIKISNGKTKDVAEKELANEFKESIVSNEELERQLEISILQQIIYKVDPSNLPESRFKRIVNIPNWKLWGLIPLCFIIWVCSIILLFKYNFLDRLDPKEWTFRFKDFDLATYIIFIVSFLGIGYFSKLIVSLFSNSKINKVNLKGEIEIGDNSNKSILNEHYDEILYFFEKNLFNVVVIEDLDRFDNTNIFTKLRELNILLNNADTLINKKQYKKFGIKFLYAVGDDLFDDKKERVKFFEYIIPIIPFINSSNAEEQLKTLIKESDIEESVFSNGFLSDITTFIDDIDMRLLINIFHEFVIYRNILNPNIIKGSEADLFAMITYKNIDPEDFKKLNNKEGKLYKLMNNKKIYIKDLIKEKTELISDKLNEIKIIEKENIDNLNELKSIYLIKISERIPNATTLYVGSNSRKFGELMNDDLFDQVINTTNFHYYQNGSGTYSSSISFEDIENEVNPDFTYVERKELIESKHNDRVEILKKEIEDLNKLKTDIENWDLKQIFREIDINLYLSEFSNNGLLRNLVSEGYINENYIDYISLFHEVSLTKDDKKFEKSVKSYINEVFEYELTHKENIVERLELKWFSRESILNFDLLDYLGNNYNKYSIKYDAVILLLSNEKERSIQFIDGYIKSEDRPLEIFFEKLVENWKDFWEYIVEESVYDRSKIDEYLRLMIIYTKTETILNNQSKKFLNEMIETNPQFLSLVKNVGGKNYYNKITNLLKGLNTKFERLDNPNEETEKLFKYVYNNNNYNINIDNLLQHVLLFGNNVDEEYYNNSNYSAVLNSECTPLIEYINSNIIPYVNNVYLKLEDNKFDEEESLIKLLNNEKLDNILKIKIIQKVETKISDLNKINESVTKEQLLLNNKVIPKWNNVTNYYSDSDDTINESLVKFLNFENVYTDLSKEKMTHKSDTFEYSVFRENLLLTNELSNESYTKILESSIYHRDRLAFENLDKDKVDYLTQKILNTTKTNYDLLKERFKNNHIKLLEKNFKTFLDKNTEFETENIDILLLLNSDKIAIDMKFDYIMILNESNVSGSKEISKKVGEIILQKSKIVEFNIDTLKSIVINQPTAEKRILLINLYFEKLKNDDVIKLLSSIWNYDNLFKNKKPTFNKTEYNRILLERLKSKGLIKNYYDNKWNDEEFRVTTNY